MAVAKQFGFSGTPSFFVNTTHFGGAYSFKDMQVAVDSAK
jgi:protein-disulfide isomerase